ncbi:MAG TPA: glycosyltransferase [Luteimonas sp.]|nr:glycosyltransferase [Luteimonas sp.]
MNEPERHPRRVSLVLPDLRHGGAQRVMLMLAGELSRFGYEIEMAVLEGGGALADQIPPGVAYRQLLGEGASRRTFALRGPLALAGYLRTRWPDVALSTMTGTNFATVLGRLLAGTDTPLILRQAVGMKNVGKAVKPWIASLYRRAEAVVAVSAGVGKELQDLGLAKDGIHVIHNPVDAESLAAKARLDAIPPQLHGRSYIVSVGRVSAQKDYPTLLRAFAASGLARAHTLAIVGNGPDMEASLALAAALGLADRVQWLGALANPYPVMAAAQLHVLASRWEGYPNVVLESLALRVPVVATDAPWGAREALEDGRRGALVAVGDVAGLAQAMAAAIGKPVPEDNQTWLERHSPRRIASQYAQLIDEVGVRRER